jgi:PPOX class probable F420-dependent enzyme
MTASRTDETLLGLLRDRGRGVLATLGAAGAPHLSTVDYTFDPAAGLLRVSTRDGLAKVRNVRRDARAGLHVGTADLDAWAAAEGRAELSAVAADPHDAAAQELVEVYRLVRGEHPDWDDYRAAMVADRRLVLRLHVTRVYGWHP